MTCCKSKRHFRVQTTSLQAASYIAYACSDALGPDSEQRAHCRAVQVEMHVHSKQLRRFRRGTDGYVNLSTPRSSISKQSPSAINSLPRTKLSSSSKPRQRERSPSTAKDTYLRVAASGEDVMGKAERPRGSAKAARVAADGLIAAATCPQAPWQVGRMVPPQAPARAASRVSALPGEAAARLTLL